MARFASNVVLAVMATTTVACGGASTEKGSPYTVTALGLNCHGSADLHSPVQEQFQHSAAIEVVNLEGDWAKVHREGSDCWVKARFIAPGTNGVIIAQPGEVALEDDGGTFRVPLQINNGVTLPFVIDSGASDVQIPADVVSVLVRQGTITQDDFIGEKTYQLADGSSLASASFRIRSLKIGDLVVENVTGSIANPKSPLLLGQSFLSRLSSWSIDNSRHVLVINKKPDAPPESVPLSSPTTPADNGLEGNVLPTSQPASDGGGQGNAPSQP